MYHSDSDHKNKSCSHSICLCNPVYTALRTVRNLLQPWSKQVKCLAETIVVHYFTWKYFRHIPPSQWHPYASIQFSTCPYHQVSILRLILLKFLLMTWKHVHKVADKIKPEGAGEYAQQCSTAEPPFLGITTGQRNEPTFWNLTRTNTKSCIWEGKISGNRTE